MSLVSTAKALAFAALSWTAAATHAATLNSHLTIDDRADLSLTAGQPANLRFFFSDAETGHSPHHFHAMHGKEMHLVVISEDLSSFAHIHPTHRPHQNPPFEITINQATVDPDNFMAPAAAPFAGRYFLFGELMPMNYGMLLFPYSVEASGQKRMPVPLEPDLQESENVIVKEFDASGEPAQTVGEAMYQVRLKIQPLDHCKTVLPKLLMEISVKSDQRFVPVTDLEPWLESYGHAIVIGRQGSVAKEKIIQHLHAAWPIPTGDLSQDERGPNIELVAHSHGSSTPTDRYKAWIQIKRAGRVLTLPFTFDWNLESAKAGAPKIFCN